MGNKRIGSARLERAFELLKRDLNMTGGTISGSPTCTLGATTLSSTLTYASGLKGVVSPLQTSPTSLTAAGALAANTSYAVNDNDAAAYTLPAQASSTAGDVINVVYTTAIGAGEVHKYGTSTEMFSPASRVFAASNAANSQIWTVTEANGTNHDFFNITGHAHGGGGLGTTLQFVFDGSKWRVQGWCYSNGDGTTAVTAVFGLT